MIRAYNAKQWEVRAILDGRKSCIRIAVKYKYSNTEMKIKSDKYGSRLIEIQKDVEGETYGKNPDGSTWHRLLPYIEKIPPYQPGDILYVRETWMDYAGRTMYRADCDKYRLESLKLAEFSWKPSIHMPKKAARIWLRVTDVRVERLNEIDEDGVLDEGFRFKPPCLTRVSADGHTCDLDGPCTSSIKYCDMTMGELFGRELWNSTIKKSDLDRYGWEANPYVWVISFERCEKPEGV